MAAGVCGVLVLVAAGSYMLTSAVTKNPATPTPRVTDGPSANTTPTTVRGTGTWTNGKPLDVPVWGAAGILLDDGRVLMAGGTAAENSKSAVATAKIIDSSGGWAGVPNMAAPRAYPMSVKLRDGSVLVAGGLSNSVPLASAERFDPSTNTWTSAGTMTVARVHATATLLNDGRVLVAGGGVEGPPNYRATNTAEIYDPNTGKWTATAPMKSARSLHVAALLPSGDVLVAGGGDRFAGDAKVSAAAEIYSPLTRAWRDAAPMAAAREGHCAVAMKSGLVLVLGSLAGGPNAASLPSAEVYEWQNNRWLAVDSMATGRGQFRATLLFDGRVMAVGGVSSQGTMLDTVELYSPATKRWVQSGAMPAPAMWPILITLQDGRVLVAGGATKPDGGSPSGMVAIFDPPNQ